MDDQRDMKMNHGRNNNRVRRLGYQTQRMKKAAL